MNAERRPVLRAFQASGLVGFQHDAAFGRPGPDNRGRSRARVLRICPCSPLEQLRRSGTASVKFSNAISHFTVTFTRDAPSSDESRTGSEPARAGGVLTGRPTEILALITGQQDLTASDIAQATGLSKAMTTATLPGSSPMDD